VGVTHFLPRPPPPIPPAVQPIQVPASTPAFRELAPGENIAIPPSNWLHARLPDGTRVGSSIHPGLPDVPQEARDKWALSVVPQFGELDVDFIAPAACMKELFALPYSNAPVRGRGEGRGEEGDG
jgi:hypothetical protein